MNDSLKKYMLAKYAPQLLILEHLKEEEKKAYQILQEIIVKEFPVMLEDVRKHMTEEFLVQAKEYIETNFSKLQGEKGEMPTDKDILRIVKPLIPQINDGHTPTEEELNILITKLLPQVKDGLTPTREQLEEIIRPLMLAFKPIAGIDYELPIINKDEIVKLVLAGISIPQPKDLVIDAKEIVKKINDLPIRPEFQIDASHIKNLPRPKKESKKSGVSSPHGGSGSWHQKVLSGTIDGVNRTFTFAGEEPSQFSERVFLNYVEQNPVNGDYVITYTTRTVVYAIAPDISLVGLPHLIRYHT